MSKYYVKIKPQFNGTYAVHKEGCPFMDGTKKKIYLGEFIDGHDAIAEAQRYFSKSKGCLFCNNERLMIKNNLLLDWNMFSYS